MAQTKVKLVSDGVITVGHLHTNHGITTDHVGEGSLLYYSDSRVQSFLTANDYVTQSSIPVVSQFLTSLNLTGSTLSYIDEDNVTTNIDLSTLGYLTSFTETDPIYTASSWYTTTNNAGNWDTAYSWGDHSLAGYLTSFTETDPIYTASSWYTTTNNSSNWDTAFGWGNHASAGYLTTVPAPLTSFSTSAWAGVGGYPGYTFVGGNSRFGFSSTTGVVDVYADGNFYATDSSHLVWHAGNDGAGSGLDADTVDGLQASAFAASSHNHTWANINGGSVNSWGGLRHSTSSGYIDFGPANTSWAHIYTDRPSFYFNVNTSSEIVYGRSSVQSPIFYDSNNTGYYVDPASTSNLNAVTVNGNLVTSATAQVSNFYIRNTSPTVYFRDTNNNSAMLHCNSNLLYVLRGGNDTTTWSQVGGQWPATWNLTNNLYSGGGAATFVGDVTANTSDRRLKENIKNIPNAIEKVKSINGVTFDWKDDLEDINYTRLRIQDVGVIAQEIQAVLPDAVRPAPFDTDEEGNSRSGENYLTVQYEKIVPLLIEAIKEQQIQIEELRKLIN